MPQLASTLADWQVGIARVSMARRGGDAEPDRDAENGAEDDRYPKHRFLTSRLLGGTGFDLLFRETRVVHELRCLDGGVDLEKACSGAKAGARRVGRDHRRRRSRNDARCPVRKYRARRQILGSSESSNGSGRGPTRS